MLAELLPLSAPRLGMSSLVQTFLAFRGAAVGFAEVSEAGLSDCCANALVIERARTSPGHAKLSVFVPVRTTLHPHAGSLAFASLRADELPPAKFRACQYQKRDTEIALNHFIWIPIAWTEFRQSGIYGFGLQDRTPGNGLPFSTPDRALSGGFIVLLKELRRFSSQALQA